MRVREVPLLASSLNTNDVFILDLGRVLFIYNGALANRAEKVSVVTAVIYAISYAAV